jgi:hypothetical protein
MSKARARRMGKDLMGRENNRVMGSYLLMHLNVPSIRLGGTVYKYSTCSEHKLAAKCPKKFLNNGKNYLLGDLFI